MQNSQNLFFFLINLKSIIFSILNSHSPSSHFLLAIALTECYRKFRCMRRGPKSWHLIEISSLFWSYSYFISSAFYLPSLLTWWSVSRHCHCRRSNSFRYEKMQKLTKCQSMASGSTYVSFCSRYFRPFFIGLHLSQSSFQQESQRTVSLNEFSRLSRFGGQHSHHRGARGPLSW